MATNSAGNWSDIVLPDDLGAAGPALPGGGLPPPWFPRAQLETPRFENDLNPYKLRLLARKFVK